MNKKIKIAQFFATNFPLNQEGLEEFIASFVVKKIPKGALLLQEGEMENRLRFINEGIVREYYASPKKETNLYFYTKPQFITDFSSFVNTKTTKKYQECLTDVELLELSKEASMKSFEQHACGQSLVSKIFQNILNKQEEAEYNRITKDPETLYQELYFHKSDWLQKIPQYHIASYLGITPETLSRIRKRIS